SKLLADLEGCYISHDNCAHQSIVCGPGKQVEAVKERLREQHVLFEGLPFPSGFHTPAVAPFLRQHLHRPSTLTLETPSRPLWSATICGPYPATAEDIQALFVRHLTEAVRFRELIGALWADGVRVFVQVGAGSLNAFVDDSLGGSPHNALTSLGAQRAPLEQL